MVCKECKAPATTGVYCRLHYIKNHKYTKACTENLLRDTVLAGDFEIMDEDEAPIRFDELVSNGFDDYVSD